MEKIIRLSTVKFFLAPLTFIYYIFCLLRTLYFKNHKQISLNNQYIIGVGNITLGGTGKTPAELFISRLFKGKVNIVTRGYGRRTKGTISGYGGDLAEKYHADDIADETFWLACQLKNSYFVITSDKEKALVEENFPYSVTVIDDAFHKFKVKQNSRICVIDSTAPWGGGWLIPSGRLRHPVSDLEFADIIWLSKTNLAGKEKSESIKGEILRLFPGKKVLMSEYVPSELITLSGEERPLSIIENKKILAFCGIGSPDGFKKVIEANNPGKLEMKIYSDHYSYKDSDLEAMRRLAGDYDYLVTTEKDIVKFYGKQDIDNLLALRMRVDFTG